MKRFRIDSIYKNVQRLTITPFNYHNSWDDQLWFDKISQNLFCNNRMLIGFGMREKVFYEDGDVLEKLRSEMPSLISESGGYFKITSSVDSSRHSSVFSLKYSGILLFKLWKYYEFFCVFEPSDSLLVTSIKLDRKDYMSFIDLKKLLIDGKTEFMLTKVDEDNELGVDFLMAKERSIVTALGF